MKKLIIIAAAVLALASCGQKAVEPTEVTMSKAELLDKIKGGWAGQTIGVVYGAPTEFKFRGTTIQDYQTIPWGEGYVMYWWHKKPGLFDDIYNDLTFVEAFEELGLDCSQDSLALRFAYADYHLAHANQAGRYNIRRGIMPPESGHWLNNPHADDLDFQIEADFIGLMAPAMLPEAVRIADKVGHIMNSGDGFYGGVFAANLYSAAFKCNDPAKVIDMALEPIPAESTFYQCIDDVRKFHKQNPDDWKECWWEINKKWNKDVGCPKGVFLNFNIDAKINAAFIAIGLLYGEGDFFKTMDISTRCGHDSDCNPASACGILGVMNGYEWIPEEWKRGIAKIEDMAFPYTDLSLNSICDMNLELMKEIVVKNGGSFENGAFTFTANEPHAVRYEQSFEGLKPVDKVVLKKTFTDELTLKFKGNSIVVEGAVIKTGHSDDAYVANVSAYIDGEKVEDFLMPFDYITRKYEIFSKYCIESGEHTLKLVLNNPHKDFALNATNMVIYDNE
mgnify:CR=1 FL=1